LDVRSADRQVRELIEGKVLWKGAVRVRGRRRVLPDIGSQSVCDRGTEVVPVSVELEVAVPA
jgi:hypothetical protein